MSLTFDLISDLHVDSWPDFNWDNQATSLFCIVAGDIAQDRDVVISTLKHLSTCYQAVFYVDGNDEHCYYLDNISASYADLAKQIKQIPNVVYLQDHVVVLNGTAIIGTNGWWGFDFDLGISSEQSANWYQEKNSVSNSITKCISRLALTDATYMISSIKRLQTHPDVKNIVIVTHTVPDPALIAHDITLAGTMRFNTMGNRYMMQALAADTEHKIHTWCFGHYHDSLDQTRGNIRFVNNCKGRSNTLHSQYAYYPRRVVID